MQRRINLNLLMILVAVSLVLGAGVHLLHGLQVERARACLAAG